MQLIEIDSLLQADSSASNHRFVLSSTVVNLQSQPIIVISPCICQHVILTLEVILGIVSSFTVRVCSSNFITTSHMREIEWIIAHMKISTLESFLSPHHNVLITWLIWLFSLKHKNIRVMPHWFCLSHYSLFNVLQEKVSWLEIIARLEEQTQDFDWGNVCVNEAGPNVFNTPIPMLHIAPYIMRW